MTAANQPAGSKKPNNSGLMLKLAVVGVFLVLLAAISFFVIRKYVSQPPQTVVLTDIAPAGPVAATPGAPVVVTNNNGPTIGGVVNNDQGAGVSNVRVRMVYPQQVNPTPGVRPQNTTVDVRTDAQGHWSTSAIPPRAINRLSITLSHNDYVTLSARGREEQLRNQSYVLTMTRGQIVKGSVVDGNDQPIAGATVTLGQRINNNPTAKSNTQGQFTLRHIPPGTSTMLVATNPGYAPTALSVSLPQAKTPVRLVLTAGRTITGRVVDKSGKPVSGATVQINQWQQVQINLGATARVTTDAQGKYTLPNAPLGDIAISAGKQGYTGGYEQLASDTSTLDFTISRELTMHGNVTDAVTGAPVPSFTVATGVKWANNGNDGTPSFSMGGTPYTGGHYQQPLGGYGGTIDAWYLRIEAKGYLPAVSPPLNASGEQNFALTPAKDLAGRVLDSAGNPVAGAGLQIALPGRQAYFPNGEMQNFGPRDQSPVTDDQGRYDMPPQLGNFALVAVAPQGYALADQDDLAKSPDIHLTPWGRIEGTLTVNGKPMADQQMNGYQADLQYDPQSPSVQFGLSANSDHDGHFTFERVPAGEISVSRLVPVPGTNNLNNAQTETVTVVAGQTATITIGSKGRPVTAQLMLPAEASTWPSYNINANAVTKITDLPPYPMPADVQTKSPAEQQKWWLAFRKTDAGKAYSQSVARQKNFQGEISPDHKLLLEDVPAGTYTLTVYAYPRAGGQMLAQVNTAFTVPAMPGGFSSEPLQLPNLVLKGTKAIAIGDPAPQIVATTLDGKEIKLSDYQGKYVLLEFWMSMLPQGTSQTDALKAVHAAFAEDKRLVMIGFSADMLPILTANYVKKNQMDWIQATMTSAESQDIYASYGLQELPDILLIGPDGKLIAKQLKGDAIMDAVTKELGKNGM